MKLTPVKYWILFSIGWLVLGVYFILSSYVYYANSSTAFNWESHLVNRMPPYFIWALITPFIYKIVTDYQSKKKKLSQQIFYYTVLGLLVSVFHRLISVSISYTLIKVIESTTDDYFTVMMQSKFVIFSYLFDSFFTYGFLLTLFFSINYYKRHNENKIKTAELENRLSQVELKALRMQLQPHFLFNTLNSISTLIHKNPDAADLMITKLSELLRFTLDSSGKQTILLSEEIEFLKTYLDIQKIRYGERIITEFNIPEKVLHIEVPALILQPTIENTIIHSVEKRNQPTCLNISAELQNGSLNLVVKDNGPGLRENHTEGIGIENTRVRLEQLYKYKSSFRLESSSEGLKTIITIPVNNND
ncbi:MAG: histidine kinase [Ignavibacteriales bacterium]|nr:MAG: histidine kinase [Ignavibacteriales bacterium]